MAISDVCIKCNEAFGWTAKEVADRLSGIIPSATKDGK
jgi:hypothetical protein